MRKKGRGDVREEIHSLLGSCWGDWNNIWNVQWNKLVLLIILRLSTHSSCDDSHSRALTSECECKCFGSQITFKGTQNLKCAVVAWWDGEDRWGSGPQPQTAFLSGSTRMKECLQSLGRRLRGIFLQKLSFVLHGNPVVAHCLDNLPIMLAII